MTDPNQVSGLPIVQEPTRAQSENVETVLNRMQTGRVTIPDYQRDADQWDLRKESLFIESVLNNLTIPAFFFAETSGTIEVVDGQQRLNTIRKYYNDEFSISDEEDMVYLTPQSTHYRGKKYSELSQELKNIFTDYPLTIIYLPRSIELSTKLEIFRRINEGGTPLTAQDIRLSYYSESNSVTFIRLAGIYSDSNASNRMIAAANYKGVFNPWSSFSDAWSAWSEWWEGTAKAKGQTPSEMFLWYLILRHRNQLDSLLSTPDSMKHLPLSFRGTTEEALDVFCAQLQYTDSHGGVNVLPTYDNGLIQEFNGFADWLAQILGRGLTGISVDKYKQMSLLIGAAVELELDPKTVSDDTWDAIAEFIRTPRSAGDKWLGKGGYPEQKGRWGGNKGQKVQCDSVVKLLQNMVND